MIDLDVLAKDVQDNVIPGLMACRDRKPRGEFLMEHFSSSFMGKGYYSVVIRGDDERVIKISFGPDHGCRPWLDGWLKWAQDCMANPGHYKPVIHEIRMYPKFFIAVMEKCVKTSPLYDQEIFDTAEMRTIIDETYEEDCFTSMHYTEEGYDHWIEVVDRGGCQEAKEFGEYVCNTYGPKLDIHDDNAMYSAVTGRIVLTDPISSGYGNKHTYERDLKCASKKSNSVHSQTTNSVLTQPHHLIPFLPGKEWRNGPL